MAEPSQPAVSVIHQKTSVKSWVFSLLKFGRWSLKYSSLVFLTRWVSQANASWQLLINTLWRGIISCHFELEAPLGVALDVALPRGGMSIRSGEWWCHLGLGEGPGIEEEEALGWALVGRGMFLGWCWKDEMPVCVPVILDRKLAAHCRIQEDWLPGYLAGGEKVELTFTLLFNSLFFKMLNALGMWLLNGTGFRSSQSLCLPDGC